jgi:hypothetical protein
MVEVSKGCVCGGGGGSEAPKQAQNVHSPFVNLISDY